MNVDHSSVDCLEIIQENETVLVLDPQEFETLILIQNRNHFAQASNTPFATPPLSNMFDLSASAADNNTLQSGLSNPHVSHKAKLILQFLKDNSLPVICYKVNSSELQTGLKKWNKCTMTSPLGWH